MDGLRFITIVEVKKYHIYNKKGQSRKKEKEKEKRKENRGMRSYLDKRGLIFFKIEDYHV